MRSTRGSTLESLRAMKLRRPDLECPTRDAIPSMPLISAGVSAQRDRCGEETVFRVSHISAGGDIAFETRVS
jgi:hypothetical protein